VTRAFSKLRIWGQSFGLHLWAAYPFENSAPEELAENLEF
jgi:hypothetical protein